MDLTKPSATARKLAKKKTRTDQVKSENENKQAARKRDGHRCRFPLCGCRTLRLRLEVSHQTHKGAGGNPDGARSTVDNLITLCVHRHQDAVLSRHKGTMRARALTAKGMNGPVAWEVDAVILAQAIKGYWPSGRTIAVAAAIQSGGWLEVARERAVQELEPPDQWQRELLARLAAMQF